MPKFTLYDTQLVIITFRNKEGSLGNCYFNRLLNKFRKELETEEHL
jgi:hypothetical protein